MTLAYIHFAQQHISSCNFDTLYNYGKIWILRNRSWHLVVCRGWNCSHFIACFIHDFRFLCNYERILSATISTSLSRCSCFADGQL